MEDATRDALDGTAAPASLEGTLASGRDTPARAAGLAQGEKIGRYLVLREVGRGAMGRVYLAYDPELDRKVALKLVRFHGERRDEADRARLLREAQAMARVTHPNVATVHDVGTHHDEVYVAMEFVEGVTVKDWCASESRRWEEVVEVFRQAGAGLAAAHAQGLVHRDFKPENAMIVASSTRVVVLDFGLARGTGSIELREGAAPTPDAGASMSMLLATNITRVGDLMGTPAYMSPEQFAGAEVGAPSDQFSFCVALYEALYGERPFRGATVAALMYAVGEGKIDAPASPRSVPQWLRRIVVRGLAPDPAQRWPAMDDLLQAIAAERPRRRRRVAVLGAGAGALLLGLGLFRALSPGEDLCGGAQRHLQGVWDDARRQQASARVDSLALPWFATGWASTVAQLDAYSARWATTHQDACEATARHGEQSQRMLDLRMSCLARARVELGAATDRLLSLDRAGAEHVHELIGALPPLARCSDLSALEATVEPPRDPATQAEVDELRQALARQRAALRMGDTAAADSLLALRDPLLAVPYPPLHGEFWVELGKAQRFAGSAEPARASLDSGLSLALTHGQLELAIDALDELGSLTGTDLQRPPEAMVYARVSEGLAGSEGVDAETVRLARRTMANALGSSGRYEEALQAYRAVLDETPAERELERASTWAGLALLLATQSRFAEAEQADRELIEIHRRLLGESHPQVADDERALGNALMAQHRYDEAEAAHRRALALALAVFPADHPTVARSRANLGTTLAAAGRHEEAEIELRAVLEILGEEHPRAPLLHANLGSLALEQGHHADAEREYRLALDLYARTVGADHPSTVVVHSTLGAALDGLGRHDEAEVEHRKALDLALAAHGEEHDLVAKARQRLGANLVDQGRPAEAIELLERSLAYRLAHDAEVPTIAATRLSLARALWDAGRDRPRAHELAREAVRGYGSAERAGGLNIDTLAGAERARAWLASHPRPR